MNADTIVPLASILQRPNPTVLVRATTMSSKNYKEKQEASLCLSGGKSKGMRILGG